MKSVEPEAYRIGHVPFLGATVYLDSRPLIPRTETEWWTERAIAEIEKHVAPRVLDLFSGSGCIGLAVLTHVRDAHVTFGEFDAAHIPTIEKNLKENNIDPTRARVIQTDVYSNIEGVFNFILANPPYLSRARIDRIQNSVLEYEPVGALFAEDDGFALIDATIAGLSDHLAKQGQCWIEHEPEHAQRIRAATTYTDQYGVIRYSVILNP